MSGEKTVDKTESTASSAVPAKNKTTGEDTVRNKYITWPTDGKCLQSLLAVHYVEDADAQKNFDADGSVATCTADIEAKADLSNGENSHVK